MLQSFKVGSPHTAMALSGAFSGVISTGHDRAMLFSGVETSLQASPCAQLDTPAIMLVAAIPLLSDLSKSEGRVSSPPPSSSSSSVALPAGRPALEATFAGSPDNKKTREQSPSYMVT
jgi:hypothetical protein